MGFDPSRGGNQETIEVTLIKVTWSMSSILSIFLLSFLDYEKHV